jgi:hypothetical protein
LYYGENLHCSIMILNWVDIDFFFLLMGEVVLVNILNIRFPIIRESAVCLNGRYLSPMDISSKRKLNFLDQSFKVETYRAQ